MKVNSSNYQAKKWWADELYHQVASFLLARGRGVASLVIVEIDNAGQIADVPDLCPGIGSPEFSKEDLAECLQTLNISPLKFREVLQTRFQIRLYEHELRRKDPNCEEYYEDQGFLGEE